MQISQRIPLLRVCGIVALSCSLTAWGSTVRHGHRAVHHSHASVRHASYSHASHHRMATHHHPVLLGQREMDPTRASEIQQALISAHYLNGSPTGIWDADSQAAMVKYQADNGWQTKITPDSRALIKLGLGPKQDDGEYAANASGISSVALPAAAGAAQDPDAVRAMASSEMPTVQN